MSIAFALLLAGGLREAIFTRAPSAANASAQARPMPLEPPVTSTRFPVRFRSTSGSNPYIFPIMPMLTTDDGVGLHYEEAGSGAPIVFVHEFAGDARSWEPQLRHFARRYRCIAYCARGYPPSDVPEGFERYSQERARDDVRSVLDALKIERAHVVGLSMGANATLHFGLTYSKRALSLTFAGGGYGSPPAVRAEFQQASRANA